MAAKEKRGLGLGLDALFAANDLDEPEGELLTLPISKVEPREAQPRKSFDEEALQALADSIAQYGLIQPIVARKLSSGYYQIIAGERRWRASRMAGLEEVPVRVIEADDRRTAELALVENLQREDLNPIEEAKGYRTLMEEYGLTQEETAKSVGRSRPAVANALRLLSLSPRIMDLVEKKELSAGHARSILSLGSEPLQWEAAQEILKKSLSVRQTEQLTARLGRLAQQKPRTDSPLTVNYAEETGNELTRLLGRRVQLQEGAKGGKIVLDYYSADDRENLIDALRKLKKEG